MLRLNYFRLGLLALALPLLPASAVAQVTVWSDNFNNGCPFDCVASTWNGWTIQNNIGGTTGSAPNNWFVSCAEEGIAPPGCGSSCIGDATLHIGANPGAGGDMGASFNETGATNATFRRAVSPTISTIGFSTLTLNFDFIAFGSAACTDDRAQLHLSTDNGATWPVGFQYCLNSVCCGGGSCDGYTQGQWTLYTLALPAAFNNNPNVRVGFHWRNNGNGSGTDPSVAIDDIRITTVVAPVTLKYFTGRSMDSRIRLNWETASEAVFDRFEIERGDEVNNYIRIGTVQGRDAASVYSFEDPHMAKQSVYYRLKMIDDDGSFTYSNTIRVMTSTTQSLVLHSFSPLIQNGQKSARAEFWAAEAMGINIELYDMQGKALLTVPQYGVNAGENALSLDISALTAGTYMFRVKAPAAREGLMPVNITQKFVIQ